LFVPDLAGAKRFSLMTASHTTSREVCATFVIIYCVYVLCNC
jgi:hypothetical protein